MIPIEARRRHSTSTEGRFAEALLAPAVLVLALGCTGEQPADQPRPQASPPLLVDVSAGSGVDFVHHNQASADRLLPETMGSGVAIFDADGDGLADLLFADGAPLDGTSRPASNGAGSHGLAYYKNLGAWRFAAVQGGGGLAVDEYVMGLAVGDVDGDGALDVLATTVGTTPRSGGDRLFRNRGDGTFEEVTRAWGLRPDGGFGSSAAFFDADGDGDLDFFSGRYVEWSRAGDERCSPDGEHRIYCTPEVYPAAHSRFLRNRGGRFVDETEAAGFARTGKTLGVVVVDADEDGRLDLAIANDTVGNQLWLNRGDHGFEESAALAGFAVDPSGSARGGMGIAAADLDGDGRGDLVVGNFANETAGLFRREGQGLFREVTAEARLGIATLLSLTFGTVTVDLDGDGRLDVVFANGHIEPEIAEISAGRQSYRQALQIFLNRGDHFIEGVGPRADYVGRGLAAGDLDGDGDLDLVLSQNGGPAVLLRNDAPADQLLRVRLCGPGNNTWGLGGEVTFVTSAGRKVTRRLEPSGSYLSSSEPLISLPLGEGEAVELATVLWPGGRQEQFEAADLTPAELAAHSTLVLRAKAAAGPCRPR